MSNPSPPSQHRLRADISSSGGHNSESSTHSSSSSRSSTRHHQRISQSQAMAASFIASNRRRRSSSSCTEAGSSHTEAQSDEEPSRVSEPPTSSRRRAKRRRIELPRNILRATSTSPMHRVSPFTANNATAGPTSSTPPHPPIPASAPTNSVLVEPHSTLPSRPFVARPRNRRPLPSRQMQIQDVIVIESSDSEDADEDAVMASVPAPPADSVGLAVDMASVSTPLTSQHSSPRRRPRQDRPPAASAVISSLLSRVRPDGDSSASDILFERIVRRASPIQVLDDSVLDERAERPAAVAQIPHNAPISVAGSGAHRLWHASPPRSRPHPLANPLLSKYTCPICLCTPYPHVVATPCGHVFCSECLFGALHAPVQQKQDAIRDQMAAFTSLSTLNRVGLGVMAQAIMGGGGGSEEVGAVGSDPAFQGGGRAALRDGQGNVVGGHTPPTAAAVTTVNRDDRTGEGGPAAAVPAPRARAPPWAPPNNANPLLGTCPVCRAEIPGGFIAGHKPANKRPAFGLELKLGKPIDDPRRSGCVVGGSG